MSNLDPSRRQLLQATVAGAALGAMVMPHVASAQVPTLRITTWGGRWGDAMKGSVLPAFEQEFKCKVEADTAFPFIPKLQASAKGTPIYDVLHTNSNEQWRAAVDGLVLPKITAKEVPNVKDVWDYATSDKIAGVSIFTNAIGLAYRTDKGHPAPVSWKDFGDRRYDGQRGTQSIITGAFGGPHLLLLGQIYGRGMKDLDAAYKALEQLKPMKVVDFAGQLEKLLLSGEVSIGLLHDSGVYRYEAENPPLAFASPVEGTLALEQVLNVTPGSKMKELSFAFIDFMLRPNIQKQLAETVWYAPANKTVKLDPKFEKLPVTPDKVAKLIQVDWKWYNEQKDDIDARVARILRG